MHFDEVWPVRDCSAIVSGHVAEAGVRTGPPAEQRPGGARERGRRARRVVAGGARERAAAADVSANYVWEEVISWPAPASLPGCTACMEMQRTLTGRTLAQWT